MTPEQKVKQEILQWLFMHKHCSMVWMNSSTGIFDPVRKIYRTNNSPYARNGTADILGIWKGWPLAIETKSKGGRLSDNQKLFLEDFARQGGIAIVAWSLNDVINALIKHEDKRIALDDKPVKLDKPTMSVEGTENG